MSHSRILECRHIGEIERILPEVPPGVSVGPRRAFLEKLEATDGAIVLQPYITHMKLSILVPPSTTSAHVSPRDFHHADELARTLGVSVGVEVPVIEGTLDDVPEDGFVVVFELPRGPLDPRLCQRVIAFDRDRSTVMKELEEWSLACAVDKFHSAAWRQHHEQQGPGVGVIGRRDVIERMPARMMSSGPFTSAHYAACVSDTARDLIELLAAYLTAYSAVVSA